MAIIKTTTLVLILINHFVCASNAISDADTLTSNLVQWVRQNGGFVSDKIIFRHINLNDSSSPHGVFAIRGIDKGETLALIPWNLIIKSPERAAGKVKDQWSKDDCGVIEETRKALTASEMDITPYGRYLLSQPQNYTVGFWTENGQELFVELTGGKLDEDNRLPPTDIDDQLVWDFEAACGGNVSDPMAVQAAMLVRARSDYEYMVPIYDMFNHDNGSYNIQHKYNPYSSDLKDSGYGIIASREIKAGEELYNSYNRCNICSGYFDWFGTPEMFLHYGFVENYPQRWLFDLARVKVDLVRVEDGSVKVKFLVPPSQKGIGLLRKELSRLNDFSKEYRNKSNGEVGMRSIEWTSMWDYYDALHAALTYVTESNETLVNDVWDLDDSWWVQEGSTLAEEDDHTVRTTPRAEL